MTETKRPHCPERTIGFWAVGLNSRLGLIQSVRSDSQGLTVYEGVTLTGEPWWSRSPTVLDTRDQEVLNDRS